MKKSKRVTIYFVSFLIAFFGIRYKISKELNKFEQKIKTRVENLDDDYLIASHRGFSSLAVENTKEAIILATSKDYVDAIEIDARMTKDSKIILSHGKYLFEGLIPKKVSELTYEEIKDKDFIYYKPYAPNLLVTAENILMNKRQFNLNFRSFKVISLLEALSYCKDKTVYLDLKFDNNTKEFTTKLKKELENVDKSNIIFQSLDLEGIKYFQEQTGFNCQVLISKKEDFAYIEYFQSIGFHYKLISYELIDNLLKQGKQISIWAINSKDVLDSVITILGDHYKEVTYITNCPDLIVYELEQKRLKKD